mmetsp:Transcript_26869/g.59423  ORF Transcript_26869/g.59423 Transcript_26869/m.59423 type:complete len:403 (-) Transcript_26869:98-1306(-)
MIDLLAVVQLNTILEDHQRIPRKQVGDVLGENLIHSAGQQALEVSRVICHLNIVVGTCPAVTDAAALAIAEVAVNPGVPRLLQKPDSLPGKVRVGVHISFTAFPHGPVIHRLSHDIPPSVLIHQPSPKNRGRSCHSQHDRSQNSKMIVQMPRFCQTCPLEGHLQTAATHTECHGVGVDESSLISLINGTGVLLWSASLWRAAWHCCVLVLEFGPGDKDLVSAALTNVPSQGGKTRVLIDTFIRDEQGLGHWPIGLGRRVAKVPHTEEREEGHRRGDLVRLQDRQQPRPSEPHVIFNLNERDQPLERLPRRALHHPRSVLRHPRTLVPLRQPILHLVVLDILEIVDDGCSSVGNLASTGFAIAFQADHLILNFVTPPQEITRHVLYSVEYLQKLLNTMISDIV